MNDAEAVAGRDTKDGASWLTRRVGALLEEIQEANAEALEAAATALLVTIRGGGLIHVAGTGHGTILVLEAFYRAGGLACVNPIWDPELLPLNGARQSTSRERSPGLGAQLAERAGVRHGDVVAVFTQSGVNTVPIELAVRGRELGATIVGVTSLAHGAAVKPRDPLGRRIADVSDIVIDTRVPAGDAIYALGPGLPSIAALSTIAGVHVWNLLLVALTELARRDGPELPIWVSSSMPGGDERVAELIATYGGRIGAL